MEYPKFTWDKYNPEELNLVRTNISDEDRAMLKRQYATLLIDAPTPAFDYRKYLLINFLSRKYNIKPTFNPTREHWLIRLVNDFVDGKIDNIEEFVEREKGKADDTD